jgi:hypothetical protein
MKQRQKAILLSGVLFVLAFLFCGNLANAQDTVYVIFGNPDSTPVTVYPGQTLMLDAYIKCTPGAYVGGLAMTLGTNDLYIQNDLSNTQGVMRRAFSFPGMVRRLIPLDGMPGCFTAYGKPAAHRLQIRRFILRHQPDAFAGHLKLPIAMIL